MKHLFTFLTLILCFSAFSQRASDLDVKITSPSSPYAADTNETFDVTILITNNGPDAITENDSLFFYLIIDGDTVQFPPQGNYEIYQEAIPSGGTFTITRPMAFNESYEGSAISFCVAMYPGNSISTINDDNQANNKSCIAIEIGEQSTVGINENSAIELGVYPNPVNDYLTISSADLVEYAEIRDVTGKTLLKKTGAGKSFDCSTLPEGLYYLLVETNGGEAMEKFVVSRR